MRARSELGTVPRHQYPLGFGTLNLLLVFLITQQADRDNLSRQCNRQSLGVAYMLTPVRVCVLISDWLATEASRQL